MVSQSDKALHGFRGDFDMEWPGSLSHRENRNNGYPQTLLIVSLTVLPGLTVSAMTENQKQLGA